MVRTSRRAHFRVVAAALLAAVTGCSAPEVCAGVGVESGIGVMFVQEGYADLAGASYELCTRGECVEGEVKQDGVTKVELPLPEDVDPGTAPVRFRVTRDGATAPLIDDSVAVKLRHQSDGCGGGAYNRGLAFTKEDGLTPDVPKKISEAWLRQLRSQATAAPEPSASS